MMGMLGVLEPDHDGNPQVAWRRTTVGTEGIQEKAMMGTLGILEKNYDGGPQASWRWTMTGTPSIPENHDEDLQASWSITPVETQPSQRKTPPATAVPPCLTHSSRTPLLTRGAIVQSSAHH